MTSFMSKGIFGKLLCAPCSAFTRHNRRGVGHHWSRHASERSDGGSWTDIDLDRKMTTPPHVSDKIMTLTFCQFDGTVSSWSVNQFVRRALLLMPWKLCAGHGAADVGPPRPRSCGHVATKTLNQCVFERHAAVRHERAVPAYGSFPFRDD